MDIIVLAMLPVAGLLVLAAAAVLMVIVAVKDTAPPDRATVLRAVAEVIRAVRGSRR
ncbi:hypothetical protein QCN29_35960 [Streptomyces sp. HNM0663]|uniref:Uncharacterized protein n=1 Tax=Streptomyces chengmaiensis TaxID=3040919 RepID=A0ABT6I006_9ACTN|nr:hypothetical protein [Streptomyces chengmaiensis]MDH2394045.1 hypothetical protein [Streptomyces chengmaiensis]